MLKKIVLILMTISLTACSNDLIKDHDYDYLHSHSVAPVQLTGSQFNQTYVITGAPYANTPPSKVPPGSELSYVGTQVKGEYPTLSISQSFASLWPQLAPAFSSSGYPVTLQDQKLGTIYIVDLAATGYRNLEITPIYIAHVRAVSNDTTAITITDNKDKPLSDSIANRVLNDLKHSLHGEKPSKFLIWWRRNDSVV